MTQQRKPLIKCENVNVYYDKKQAVNEVSFCVFKGDYLCIVGENGSGKSLIVKSVLGLVKKSSGEIEFNDLKQNEIGYLPQQSVVQKDFPASVFEVVLSGCLNKKGLSPFYNKKDKQLAKQNIEKLGIQEIEKKSYRDLSGGQQQRVLLARALCAMQKLIVLDEPTAGLDPVVASEFYQIVEKLNKTLGTTIIMVSHDISRSVQYSNMVLHMNQSAKFFGETSIYKETALYRRMIGGEI